MPSAGDQRLQSAPLCCLCQVFREWRTPWDTAAGLGPPLPVWGPLNIQAPPSACMPLPLPCRMLFVCGSFLGTFTGQDRVGRRSLQSAEQGCVLRAVVLRAVLLHASHLSPMQADELSNPFGQISLSRQGSTEAPDPSSAMFQSSLISQHPQQTGFIMATPGQPIPTSNYSASGHTAPTQQVLQPQGYIQPPQQVRTRASLEGMCASGQSCQARGCWERFPESGSPLFCRSFAMGQYTGAQALGWHAPLLGTG